MAFCTYPVLFDGSEITALVYNNTICRPAPTIRCSSCIISELTHPIHHPQQHHLCICRKRIALQTSLLFCVTRSCLGFCFESNAYGAKIISLQLPFRCCVGSAHNRCGRRCKTLPPTTNFERGVPWTIFTGSTVGIHTLSK